MSPVLTCITENPVAGPVVESVNSANVGEVEAVGTGLVSFVVNRMNIATAGPNFNFYDPSGPDAGLNVGLGNTIVSWTETSIIVSNAGMAGLTVTQVFIDDYLATYSLTFLGAGITGVVIL